MHKYMEHTAAALLAEIFAFGQVCTAFAAQGDSDYGLVPGTAKPAQISPDSEQAPGGNQTQIAPQEVQFQKIRLQQTQGTPIETPSGNDAAASVQAGANAADAQVTVEQAAATKEAAMQMAVIANAPYLQIQVLRPDVTWSEPVINNIPMVSEGGFHPLCIYLNNIVSNVPCRAYISTHGWNEWAMNGDHTTVWEDGSLVKATRIHFIGFVGNTFDVYYSSTLNDETKLNWVHSDQTAGAIGTDKVMQGFRVSLWGENVDGTTCNTTKPAEAAIPDGIQTIGGVAVYGSGTGVPSTGWGQNGRDKYYLVNNVPVIGRRYIDGYKHYFDETGKVITDLGSILGTTGPFLIRTNKQVSITTVYMQDGGNGFIILPRMLPCFIGEDIPLGAFKTPKKYRQRLMNSGVCTRYATCLGSDLSFLLHSAIYGSPNVNILRPETYSFLGVACSADYIRCTSGDSKWIFDRCSLGTTIEIYNSSIPSPYDRPAIERSISADQHWDPTGSVAIAALSTGQQVHNRYGI